MGVPPNVFVTLAFYIRYLPDPTPGVHPTSPSRFNFGLLHTILDERLGIFESYDDESYVSNFQVSSSQTSVDYCRQ